MLDEPRLPTGDADSQMSDVTTCQAESQIETQSEEISNPRFTGSIYDLLNIPSRPGISESRTTVESPVPPPMEPPISVEPTIPLEYRGTKRRRSSEEEEFDPQVGSSKRRKSDQDSDSDPKSGPGFGGPTGGADPGLGSGSQDTSGPSDNFRSLGPKEMTIYLFSFLASILESLLDAFL